MSPLGSGIKNLVDYRATPPLGKSSTKRPERGLTSCPGPPKSSRILAFELTLAHLGDLARHSDAKHPEFDAKTTKQHAKTLHKIPTGAQKARKTTHRSFKILQKQRRVIHFCTSAISIQIAPGSPKCEPRWTPECYQDGSLSALMAPSCPT